MSGSGEKGPGRFVVDTNVFVSAVKPFSERGHGAPTDTGSLALLLRLINDDRLELFGNLWLADEYRRLAEELHSETSGLLLGLLTKKMKEIAGVDEEAVARCRPYLPDEEAADVIHAATCLQAGAILISNDGDFDRIRDAGIIEVWSIGDAIRRLHVFGGRGRL